MKFGDLINKYRDSPDTIPEWLRGLDREVNVCELNLSSSELIQDYSGPGPKLKHFQHTVGIIVSGRAELYELLPNHFDVLAYRPIRIFERGDTFGEFELLDGLHESNKVGQNAASNYGPRETWRIAAGYQCLIPTRKWQHKHYLEDITDGRMLERYPFFFDYKTNEYVHPAADAPQKKAEQQNSPRSEMTCVALLNLTNEHLKANESIRLGLHELGWRRAQAYRKCVNSFNWNAMMAFRSEAERLVQRDFSEFLQKKLLVDPIADAVMDALNRPLRGEPCYMHLGGTENMLYASDDFSGTFYFPIDLHNYFVCLGLHHASKGRRPDGNRYSELVKVFPGNGKQFSEDLIGLVKGLVSSFKSENGGYPFVVDAEIFQGATRQMLLLRYEHEKVRR